MQSASTEVSGNNRTRIKKACVGNPEGARFTEGKFTLTAMPTARGRACSKGLSLRDLCIGLIGKVNNKTGVCIEERSCVKKKVRYLGLQPLVNRTISHTSGCIMFRSFKWLTLLIFDIKRFSSRVY